MRMKWIATGLLVLAALVYVLSEKLGYYYLAAFSEAAMVGALADWFAVVALFKRPLNLPIPHTAIIPAQQGKNRARAFGLHPAELSLLRRGRAAHRRVPAGAYPVPVAAQARQRRHGGELRGALRGICAQRGGRRARAPLPVREHPARAERGGSCGRGGAASRHPDREQAPPRAARRGAEGPRRPAGEGGDAALHRRRGREERAAPEEAERLAAARARRARRAQDRRARHRQGARGAGGP